MKKKFTPILIILIASLIFYKVIERPKVKSIPNKITYNAMNSKGFPESVSIYDSDISKNLLLMENIVGTLVKYSNSGSIEPFLAESWTRSENGKTWQFKLRPDITSEDGIVLTSSSYLQSFYRIVKKINKGRGLPAFGLLNGYDEFASGKNKTIRGIKTLSPYKIQFSFKEAPSGFLEFLSMPYYGFISPRQFDKDNNWINNKKIFSTGIYKINSWTEKEIILENRLLNSLGKNAIKTVSITKDFNHNYQLQAKNLFITRVDEEKVNFHKDHYYEIFSIPTILYNINISSHGIFSQEKIRQTLRNELLKKHYDMKKHFITSNKANGFYHRKSNIYMPGLNNPSNEYLNKLKGKTLKIVTPTLEGRPVVALMKKLLERTFPNSTKLDFEVISFKDDTNWKAKYHNEDYYDIRLGGVNAGSYPIKWVLEMMFCSKIGVSYPDPDNLICNKINSNSATIIETKDFQDEFEDIIKKQATTIPLFHSSLRWLFSSNISPESVDPTSSVLRFDQIRVIQ